MKLTNSSIVMLIIENKEAFSHHTPDNDIIDLLIVNRTRTLTAKGKQNKTLMFKTRKNRK